MKTELIKERLARLKGQNESPYIWKPKEGKTIIRLLPYKYHDDDPFIELYFHYDVTGRSTVSPISYEEPDPIYNFAQTLLMENDKESFKLAKKLEPKLRVYVPILVRGLEHEGVKFWGFGKTIYEELLNTMDDDDYGDISDPKTGRDITVSFEKATGPDSYPKTTMVIKPNSSPVTTDKEVLSLIKEMPNINVVFPSPTKDFLEKALERFINLSESKEVEAEKIEDPNILEGMNDDELDSILGNPPANAKTAAPSKVDTAPESKVVKDPINNLNIDDFDDLFK